MNKELFYDEIINTFKQFEIEDIVKINKGDHHFLVLTIDEEDDLKEYKIIIDFMDDDYLSIYTSFKHNVVTNNDKINLLKIINKFNKESFLKFQVDNKYLFINYNLPELNQDDYEKVVRIVCIIPNLIKEFHADFKKYME